MSEPKTFEPCWPENLKSGVQYRIPCDDKGRNGGSWLQVFIADDGDVHISMQDWEEIPEGKPSPFPSVRIRTLTGGGRSLRTHQALLWLADAIRRDTSAEPKKKQNGKCPTATQMRIIQMMGDGLELTAPSTNGITQGLAQISRMRVSINTLCSMADQGLIERVLRTQHYGWGDNHYWQWILTEKGFDACQS